VKRAIATTSLALLSTVGMVFALATPAYADDGRFTMWTDDGDPGGRVVFHADGDYVELCDKEADGYGVYLTITDTDGNGGYSMSVGGNDECKVHRASEGGKYDLEEGSCLSFHIGLGPSYKFDDYALWKNASDGGNC
jgi:hypothetical protein